MDGPLTCPMRKSEPSDEDTQMAPETASVMHCCEYNWIFFYISYIVNGIKGGGYTG